MAEKDENLNEKTDKERYANKVIVFELKKERKEENAWDGNIDEEKPSDPIQTDRWAGMVSAVD